MAEEVFGDSQRGLGDIFRPVNGYPFGGSGWGDERLYCC